MAMRFDLPIWAELLLTCCCFPVACLCTISAMCSHGVCEGGHRSCGNQRMCMPHVWKEECLCCCNDSCCMPV